MQLTTNNKSGAVLYIEVDGHATIEGQIILNDIVDIWSYFYMCGICVLKVKLF